MYSSGIIGTVVDVVDITAVKNSYHVIIILTLSGDSLRVVSFFFSIVRLEFAHRNGTKIRSYVYM